jgi:hypothetical protein
MLHDEAAEEAEGHMSLERSPRHVAEEKRLRGHASANPLPEVAPELLVARDRPQVEEQRSAQDLLRTWRRHPRFEIAAPDGLGLAPLRVRGHEAAIA